MRARAAWPGGPSLAAARGAHGAAHVQRLGLGLRFVGGLGGGRGLARLLLALLQLLSVEDDKVLLDSFKAFLEIVIFRLGAVFAVIP